MKRAPTHGNIRLNLLGAFSLTGADGTVLMTPGKPLAVLAYLATARNERASRSALADMLWSDSSDVQRRGSLRQAIFTLRQQLGADAIGSDGEWLSLQTPLYVDVEAFVRAVAERDYARAVALYTGDFLPGFAAPGASDFERWIDTERLRLRGSFLASAAQELRELTARGEVEHALAVSQRLVDEAPEDDAMWRRRFDVLALAGRPGPLLLEVSTLRAMRAEEGVALDPSLERFIAHLIGSMAVAGEEARERAPSYGIPSSPEFQGRSDVFTALLAAWGRAVAGAPQRFLVVGNAGLGKTRLLQELERRLTTRRVQVVRIAAHQRERDHPYAMLESVVARIADLPGAAGIAPASANTLAGLVPRLADEFSLTPSPEVLDGETLLLRRGRALADLLSAVAEDAPLVVLLDDVHWADATSVHVIERAWERLARVPLLCVVASRYESPDFGCGDARLTLAPLSLSDVTALLTSIADLPRVPEYDRVVDALYAATGGAPYAVLRLLQSALSSGVIRLASRQWDVADADTFRRFLAEAETAAGRLGALGADDRALLSLLEIADTPMHEPSIVAATGGDAHEIAERLARLERSNHVVRDGASCWALSHALIGEDVRALTPVDERMRIARAVATALAPLATDLTSLRRIVRLYGEAAAHAEALHVAVRWYGAQRVVPYSAEAFVNAITGPDTDATFVRALLRAVRRRRRWWRSPPVVASATALFTLAMGFWFMLQPVRVVSTGVLEVSALMVPDLPFEVPLRFEVLNRFGLRTSRRDGETMEIAPADPAVEMRGRRTAVVRDGVAEFDSLYPPRTLDLVDLRVTMHGLPSLLVPMPVRGDSLAVIDALMNGQMLRDSAKVLRVRPGEEISGRVRMRYSTLSRVVLYVMAQTTTWHPAQSDTLTVRSLLAGVSGAQFVMPLRLTAPERRGSYWILWVHGAEPAAVWLLSGTNWMCRKPHWGDENDLTSRSDAELSRAVANGQIKLWFEYCDRGNFRREERPVAIAGLRVVVE